MRRQKLRPGYVTTVVIAGGRRRLTDATDSVVLKGEASETQDVIVAVAARRV